jgi:hypothetical protein
LPSQDPQADAAATLSEQLVFFRQARGTLVTDEASSSFVAYYDGFQLRYVIERIDLGTDAATVNQYAFENGRLFHYLQNGRSRDAWTGEGSATTMRVSFDPDGGLLKAGKWVNGEAALVTDDEVLTLRIHVARLQVAADDARIAADR